MAVVYTGGTFDMFHAGHVDFLRVCKKVAGEGDVVVALNRDEFVEGFKGKRPVCCYEERRVVLEACMYVDVVIENTGDQNSCPSILSVHPDFILIGDDWAGRDYYKQMGFTREWLDRQEIVLLYVPRQRIISSTAIKERTRGQLGTLSVPARSIGFVEEDADVAGSPEGSGGGDSDATGTIDDE